MKNVFVFVLALTLVAPALAAGVTPAPEGKAAPRPDLEVVKLTATPAKNGKVRVTYTVKNNGYAKSGPSVTRVMISTAGIKATQQNTPALKPGDNFTTSTDYVIAKEGQYQIKATADFLRQVSENNEKNNENKIQFGVSRSL